MRSTNIIYWISTGVISLMMIFSACLYLTQPAIDAAFKHLGFPAYFRIELAIAKLTGAILILIPLHSTAKEWVYAGFTIVFISAFIAHYASGDKTSQLAGPVVFFLVLALSYLMHHRRQKHKELRTA